MTRSLRAPDHAEEEPDVASDAAGTSGSEVPEGLDRLRVVLAAAMGTVLVTYAMLVPAALLVVLAGGGADSSVDGAFAAAIPLWLAAHLIPLALEGQPLSLLPLLPTVAVVVVVAWGARWAARRLGGRIRQDAGAVVAASAGAHAAVAVLGSALLPTSAAVGAAPWAAMLGAGLIAVVGAGIGVLRACGLPADWRERLQGWPAAGLAGAAVGGAALLFAGALAVLVGLVVGASRVHGLYGALAPTGGAALGMTLLAVAYMPNAAIAGASWLLGPGLDVGLGAWTPFGGAPGPLPPFPLLGALPTVPSPAWAVVVVIVPVVIGLGVGGICRAVLGPHCTVPERMRAVGVATGTLALVAALAATLAGGRLAAGRYDPVAMPAWLALLAVVVWIGGPAAVLALVQRGGPGPEEVRDDEELGWYRDGYPAEFSEDEEPVSDGPDLEREGEEPEDRSDVVEDAEEAERSDDSRGVEDGVGEGDGGGSEPADADASEANDADAESDEEQPLDAAAGPNADSSDAAGEDSAEQTAAPDGASRGRQARGRDGRSRSGRGRAVERARARRQERSNGGRSRPIRFRPVAAPTLGAVEDLPPEAGGEPVDDTRGHAEDRDEVPADADRVEPPPVGRSGFAERSAPAATPASAERSEQSGGEARSERPDRGERPDRAGRPERSDPPRPRRQRADPTRSEPVASSTDPVDTDDLEPEPRPRTVGELVAQRARQAEERAARDAAEGGPDAP
ncbi:DUF6350 family protein [Pseudonocardia kujensis]|uniref:cell division protein PerM n=1 Tax=Pseudonocardia kujensis TaxID=1128675 RepID=UPI001E593760|nr:DUF6350 family protein [Pseudonocardia kujensis]MCE0767152.1 DUF6350 family protein [Pseudonocardia kujensis]